jgi:predicted RNA-binding protein with RPS1 domain
MLIEERYFNLMSSLKKNDVIQVIVTSIKNYGLFCKFFETPETKGMFDRYQSQDWNKMVYIKEIGEGFITFELLKDYFSKKMEDETPIWVRVEEIKEDKKQIDLVYKSVKYIDEDGVEKENEPIMGRIYENWKQS